jgi:tetratricopeptide (TPR) repeat protein
VGKHTCPVCASQVITDSDYYFRQGMDAIFNGNLDLAIKLLENCIEINPEHISGRYNIGEALSSVNKYDEALAHYVFAAQKRPDIPGIYTALGKAAFGSFIDHTKEAEIMSKSMICLFKKAIELNPKDIDAYCSLGNAYLATGETEKAISCFLQCLKIAPSSSIVYYELAKVYTSLEQFPEALDMVLKSLMYVHPEDPIFNDIRELMCDLEMSGL